MIELFAVARRLQQFFQDHGWRFCFIGGVALQRWGEPRVTQDVDVTLFTGFSGEETFIDPLLAAFPARVAEPRTFALQYRVLLLKSDTNIGIDIALGGLPFEDAMISRASAFDFLPDVTLFTCSAEDLVVLKAFADRPRDWVDIEGVLLRQRGLLDWAYIERTLAPLVEVKEAPHIMMMLTSLRTRLDAS
jgi:hypothetical protein